MNKDNNIREILENRDFKGVWIDKYIWLNKELTWMEKLLYTEIESLDKEKGCFAMNNYFSRFFDISKARITQIIGELKRKDYVTVTLERKNQMVAKRIIKLTQKAINIKLGAIKYSKQPIKNTRQPIKNTSDNINTVINTNNKDTKVSIGESSTLLKENFLGDSFYELNKSFLDIIIKCIPLGNFSKHKIPKQGEEPNKTIQCIIKYLKEIKSGHFFESHKFRKDWLKSSGVENIDNKSITFKRLESMLSTSCKRFNERRNNSRKATKSMAHFLYNTETNISQFLYNIFNEVEESNTSKIRKIKAKFEKKLLNKLTDVNNKYKRPVWGEREELLYFTKMYSLKVWYEKNWDDLEYYNTIFHQNRFNFRTGNFELFLDKIDKYYEDVNGMWRRDFLDPKNGSADWDGFRNWLLVEDDIELEVDKEDMKKAKAKKKEELKKTHNVAIEEEMNFTGGTKKQAEKELRQQAEVKKLMSKHIKILEAKYEKLGKEIHRKVLVGTAETNARKELGYDDDA